MHGQVYKRFYCTVARNDIGKNTAEIFSTPRPAIVKINPGIIVCHHFLQQYSDNSKIQRKKKPMVTCSCMQSPTISITSDPEQI